MDVISTILAAAKAVGVNGTLLLAICSHESNDFKVNYVAQDRGSPSYGSCQLKVGTAALFGFKGNPNQLNELKTNAKYAALYLRRHQEHYGEDWIKLTAAYNAGSFFPSKKNPRCPKNMGYVKLVQKKLPLELQRILDCDKNGEN